MKHVASRYSRAEAIARLSGGWWRKLESHFAGVSGNSSLLPKTEAVWMPHYLFGWRVWRGESPSDVFVSVGGHDGTIRLLRQEELVFGPVDERCLDEFAIGVEEAEASSRVWLRLAVGQQPRIPDHAESVERIGYPLWVHYFRRFRGRIDLRILDGLTGQVVGSKVVAGFLHAIERSGVRTARCGKQFVDL